MIERTPEDIAQFEADMRRIAEARPAHVTPVYPIIYVNREEKRRIDVYPDYKLRYQFWQEGATPVPDHWILYRRDVPNLSDETWFAPPISAGWERIQ